MFSVMGSALRPVLTTALVSQMLTKWVKLLHKEQVSHLQDLYGAAHDLLLQGLIAPIPELERFSFFYYNLFMILKKEGVRPILDLKALNYFVKVKKLRMECIFLVVASLHQVDFFSSINLNKDVYLHISIAAGLPALWTRLSNSGMPQVLLCPYILNPKFTFEVLQ